MRIKKSLKSALANLLGVSGITAIGLNQVKFRDFIFINKMSTIAKASGYTMIGYRSLANIYELTTNALKNEIQGDFVEFGCNLGGSTAIMGILNEKYGNRRTVWYFDSFEGLPSPTKEDGNRQFDVGKGTLKAPYERVTAYLYNDLKLPKSKNKVVKGFFEDTVPKVDRELSKIAVLRIDADYYEPYKYILEKFYERVSPGGYIIFDDYAAWEGARKAVDDFFESRNNIQLVHIYHIPGPVYIQKPYEN